MKAIYVWKLKPQASIHIGEGNFDVFFGANGILRDHNGSIVIPGTSIAGVFFETLRSVLEPDEKTLKIVTGPLGKKNDDNEGSLLWFRSFKSDKAKANVRDRVKICPATRTAEDHAKFSQWEIDPDGWTLTVVICVESRVSPEQYDKIKEWLNAVAYSWKTEGVAFGAFSAAGLGWCELKSAKVFEINKANIETFLDNSVTDLMKKIIDDKLGESHLPEKAPKNFKSRYAHYDLTVTIPQNDWGIDALLIRGGAHIASVENPETDAAFIRDSMGIFIPGSSVKGAFRAFIHKYDNENVKFFGNAEDDMTAGNMLIEDLRYPPSEGEKIKNNLKLVNRHAEDEFTRAIYGGAKFDEERLFGGSFKGKIRIPVDDKDQWEAILTLLEQGFDHRLIGLGAANARVQFTIVPPSKSKQEA